MDPLKSNEIVELTLFNRQYEMEKQLWKDFFQNMSSGLCSSFLAYSKQTEKLNRPKKEILLPHRSTTERQFVYTSKRTGLADDAQIE